MIKYVPEECSRLVQGEIFLFIARARFERVLLTLEKLGLQYISMPSRTDFLHTIPSFL